MSNADQEPSLAVIPPSESEYEYAPSRMNYNDTHAPYGYAGFLVGECTVVCVECHDEEKESTESPIFGDEEADYPGLHCMDCGRYLDTRLLVYRSGPGCEIWGQLDDHHKL